MCENSIKEAVQSVGCGSREMWIINCGPVVDRCQIGRYRTWENTEECLYSELSAPSFSVKTFLGTPWQSSG